MIEKIVLTAMLFVCVVSTPDIFNEQRQFHGVGDAHTVELKRKLTEARGRWRLIPQQKAKVVIMAQSQDRLF